MPTVLRKYGIRFHFYGSDMGEPAHIHASGNGKAKVWLDGPRVEHSKGFNAGELKRIIEVATDHNEEFQEAWDEFARRVS